MIYTVTLNPCLDYVVGMESFRAGELNRTGYEDIYVGGKGINVSLILKELGMESTALGFVGGFTGDVILKYLKDNGIKCDFVKLSGGNSRINVKIKATQETEINARGPYISGEEYELLSEKLGNVEDGDFLILSGSVPPSLPGDIYERMLERVAGKDVKKVVDASGELLKNTLKYKPFLVKPNNHELGELFGVKIESARDAEPYARELRGMGAENVLVSLGGEGALLVDSEDKVYTVPSYDGVRVNTVGAGDSMVAGFVAGIMTGGSEHALRLGSACGGATAFLPGLAKKKDIEKLLKEAL